VELIAYIFMVKEEAKQANFFGLIFDREERPDMLLRNVGLSTLLWNQEDHIFKLEFNVRNERRSQYQQGYNCDLSTQKIQFYVRCVGEILLRKTSNNMFII
jgi:hypothetical protein